MLARGRVGGMAEVNWGDLGAGASGRPEHLPIPTDPEQLERLLATAGAR